MKRRATANIKRASPAAVRADLRGGFSESMHHSLAQIGAGFYPHIHINQALGMWNSSA
jgi:hypothetical protein